MKQSIGAVRRRTVVGTDDLVRMRQLDMRPLPIVIEPTIPGIDLVQWAGAQQSQIESVLVNAGGILFRNFEMRKVEQFQAFVEAACGPLVEYKERSSPRSLVSGHIFTSTDYPPSRSIFLHTEQSYNYAFPSRIAFFCVTEPAEGGETPIADTRRVLQRIQPGIRSRFEEQGYLYVRNFGGGAGLSWQEAFQTENRREVEEHCRRSFIQFEWTNNGGLRTRQRRPVVARHPSGIDAWFNHLTFFHISTLELDVREQMLAHFSEADLPNNTYYGDGSAIEPEIVQKLREAYLAELISFKWRAGDILLLDNVLTAHGRSSFTPPRKIVVAMARPWTWSEVSSKPLWKCQSEEQA